MAEDEKRELTAILNSVVQIGLVVEDLDAKMEGMRKVFALEPDSVFEAAFKDTVYRGRLIDAPARIANYDHFGVQLEFIQPLGDTSIWRDFLNEGPHHGHSLHHVRFTDVEDNDAMSALMAKRGIDVYQEVKSFVRPGGKSTYYDTVADLGFLVEVTTKSAD
jgi:hypothetical protein